MRRLVLTTHVVASVGWLGAVGAFLGLALAGLADHGTFPVRAAYVAADVVTWAVIVPLCVASLLTGVVQGLGTPWGLLRHWWVLIKLVLTVVATALLLLHTQPIGHLARVAATGGPFGRDLDGMRIQLVADAAAALLVLLGATVLAIYKPRGRTRFARRTSASAG